MKTSADYVLQAKRKLGNAHMSDRLLGEAIGVSGQTITDARFYGCSDPTAMKLAQLLGIEAGELLLVARAEREKDGPIKSALMAYAKKALASVPTKALSAVAALAVVLGALLPVPAHSSDVAKATASATPTPPAATRR